MTKLLVIFFLSCARVGSDEFMFVVRMCVLGVANAWSSYDRGPLKMLRLDPFFDLLCMNSPTAKRIRNVT